MTVKIRLKREGRKKIPSYSIVIIDSRKARDGKYIEKVGNYHPLLEKDNPNRVVFNEFSVKSWLTKGAQPTNTVLRLLVFKGIIKNPNVNI